jgi:membrane fusion protein (multidrug efflux system)
MSSGKEAALHALGESQHEAEIAALVERCRLLAADIEGMRRSQAALDRGDNGLSELQDGHVRGHAIDLKKELVEMQPAGGSRRLRIGRLAIPILLACFAILGGLWMWQRLGSYESTDDAQIEGHLTPISTRISGTVAHVYVENTQFVRVSAPLTDLDTRDYEIAVEKARADLAQAKAQVAGAQGDYQAGRAKLAESVATNLKMQQDADRYRALLDQGVAARQQYDEAVRAARVAAAAVESDRASVIALQKQIVSREAIAAGAQASLDQALLNLSYTHIVSPVSGVIGKKAVEVGQQIERGQQLLAIVPLDDIWVTANFKETQLRRIKLGQRVSIHVDALGSNYSGYIDGLAGASGEVYSILPPENATGNYIKVVQRFPLRILFDPGQDAEHRLRPGMSVEPTVWLNESSKYGR